MSGYFIFKYQDPTKGSNRLGEAHRQSVPKSWWILGCMCSSRRASSLLERTQALGSVLFFSWKANYAYMSFPYKALALTTTEGQVLLLVRHFGFSPFLFQEVLLWLLLGIPERGRCFERWGQSQWSVSLSDHFALWWPASPNSDSLAHFFNGLRAKVLMAKSEAISRVIRSFGCSSGDIFSLAPQNCSASKYSGYHHLLFLFWNYFWLPFRNQKLTVWQNWGMILVSC